MESAAAAAGSHKISGNGENKNSQTNRSLKKEKILLDKQKLM